MPDNTTPSPSPVEGLQQQQATNVMDEVTSSPEMTQVIQDNGGNLKPWGTDLSQTAAYQQERGLVSKMLYDRQNFGGVAPSAVENSKKHDDPQDYRDRVATMKAMSFMTGVDPQMVSENYGAIQRKIEQQHGWDASATPSQFAGKLQGLFQQQDAQKQALQNVQGQAIKDYASMAGKGMSPNPIASYTQWEQQNAGALSNVPEAQRVQMFNAVYAPIQKAMSAPEGQKAFQLVNALTQNRDAIGIPEQGADQVSADVSQGKEAPAQPEKIDPVQLLKGMTDEQQNKVISLAAQLMQANQPNMGNGMKVAGGLAQAFAQGFTSWSAIAHFGELEDAEKRLKAAQSPEEIQKAQEDIRNVKLAQKIKQADQQASTVNPELYGLPNVVYKVAQGVAAMPGALAPVFVPGLGEYAFYKQAQAEDSLRLMEQNPGMTAEEARNRTTIASAAYGITIGRLAPLLGEASPGLMGFLTHTAQSTLIMQGAEAERIIGRQLQSLVDPSFNPKEEYGQEWYELLKATPYTFATLAAFGGAIKLMNRGQSPDPNSLGELEKQAGNPRLLQYLGIDAETANRIAALPAGERVKALGGEWEKRTDEQKQAGVELARQDADTASKVVADPSAPRVEQTPDGKYVVVTKSGEDTHVATFDTQEGAQAAVQMTFEHLLESKSKEEKTGNDWTTATDESPVLTISSEETNSATPESEKTSQVSARLGQEFNGELPAGIEVVHEPDANWNAKIENGKIQVNAAHLSPEEAVHEMHEEILHAAWGDEATRPAFEEAWKSLPQETQDRLSSLVERLYGDHPEDVRNEETRVKAVKEILKEMRNPENKGAWDKFVEAIKAIWERITGSAATNPEDIAARLLALGKAKMEGRETRHSIRDQKTDPYKKRNEDEAGEPLTPTEIQEGIEDESGTLAEPEVDDSKWDSISDSGTRFSIKPEEDHIPVISPKNLKGKSKFVYFSDRMRVGTYTGLDPKSGISIPLQGGPSYPFTKGNYQKGAGWAFTIDRMFKRFQKRIDSTDGIGLPTLYASGNVRANHTFLKAYFEEVNHAISTGKLKEKDFLKAANEMRSAVAIPEKAEWKNQWTKKWTSLEQAEKALAATTFEVRGGNFFGWSPDKVGANKGAKIGRDDLVAKGFPNITEMVKLMEDPRFEGVPAGSIVGAIQFEKGQVAHSTHADLGVDEHLSYPVISKGKGLGFFESPIPALDVLKTDKEGRNALRSAETSMAGVRFSLRDDPSLQEKTSDLPEKDKDRFFKVVDEFSKIDKARGSANFWNGFFKGRKATSEDVDRIESQLSEWKAYYAKQGNQGDAQEASKQADNPIQDVLDRYHDGDESVSTPGDLVNELDALAGELDNQALENAVREYRDARRDEMEMYGERGGSDDAAFDKLVSVAQKVAREQGQTRFSLREKERDKAYDAAVKAGDEAEQQRLVDEAAKDAGYTVGPLYHGTSEPITSFDKSKFGSVTNTKRAKKGVFFTSDNKVASEFANNASYRNGKNGEGYIVSAYLKLENPLVVDFANERDGYEAMEVAIAKAEAEGHDGVYFKNAPDTLHSQRVIKIKGQTLSLFDGVGISEMIDGIKDGTTSVADAVRAIREEEEFARSENEPDAADTLKSLVDALESAPNSVSTDYSESADVHFVFNPNQIKSAYPITRDDAGNVIPLSQRFNAESNDIRYSFRNPGAPSAVPSPKTFREQAAETLSRVGNIVRELPKDSDFKRHLLQWSARSQASSNEVERIQHTIETTIKDKAKRDGITNWIEAGGDRALLLQRAAASKDEKTKAGYEAAANLTSDELKVAQKVAQTFAILEARAKKWGIDFGHRENYVPHVYDQEPQAPSGSSSKRLSEFFKFSQQRTFETYFGGEQAGFKPQTKDISKLLGLYLNDMNNAINSRRFVADLSKAKASDGRPLVSPRGSGTTVEGEHGEGEYHLIYPDSSKEGHEDYKTLDQPALHDWSFAGMDDNGKNILVKGDIAVHPEVAKHFSNALGSSKIRQWWNTKTDNPFLNAGKTTAKFLLDDIQGYVKGTMLSFSPFHQVQEGIHAVGHRINPFSGIPKIDLRDPEQADAAAHGLMLSHDRLSQSLFMEGVGTNDRNLVTMALRKIGWGLTTAAADKVEAYQHWLFSAYIPGLKFKTYQHILERNMERFAGELKAGTATEFQVKNLSAQQANAAYGHLNYTELGHNPTIRHAFQIALLAPDFLEARARFVAQSAKSLTGAKTGYEQMQAFAFLAVTQVVAATIQKVLTNGEADLDHPFEMRFGNKYYGMRSVPEDVYKAFHNPTGFIGGRISPIFGRFVQEGVFGVNYRGEHTTVGDAIKDILAGTVPMPMQTLTRQWTDSGKANPISPFEQILSSAGVQVHRYSPITTMYPIAEKWVQANHPEDVRARGAYPVSKFQQLRYACEDGDKEAIQKEIKRLEVAGLTPAKLASGFKSSVNHPFTGKESHDADMAKTLSEDDKQTYHAAIERRKLILERFNQFKNSSE